MARRVDDRGNASKYNYVLSLKLDAITLSMIENWGIFQLSMYEIRIYVPNLR